MKCLECNKSTKNPKFCNRSCSVSYNNRKQPKRNKQIKPCKQCSKPMTIFNKSFCSRECRSNNTIEKSINEIVTSGLLTKRNTHTCNLSMKNKLSIIKGEQCSICNQEPIWNNKPLIMIVDHINGVSNDWRLDNLRLVCPNCDTQLPTFKSRNKNGNRPR